MEVKVPASLTIALDPTCAGVNGVVVSPPE